MIKENYLALKARVEAACLRAGREAGSVAIVAVSKGRGIAEIRQALDAGATDIGENRVQEALSKYNLLTTSAVGGSAFGGNDQRPTAIKWHLIGHLQSNKAKNAVKIFDLIHSVDSLKLAREIDEQAARIGKVQEVLIEVKTSLEETKSGILPEEADKLLAGVSGFKNLTVKGLMTIAPLVNDPEEARPFFRQLRLIAEKVFNAQRTTHNAQPILSMGMSDDFVVAIEEGATLVRIGKAIFKS